MKPIYEAKNIQIEITNHCNKSCLNCSRFCGHHENPYFMSIDMFIDALASLEGYKGTIGLMGGEPTLHPQFWDLCVLLQDYVPFERRALWTNGAKWDDHEKIIRETFPLKHIVYNAHDYEYKGQHQPILIASKEIVGDEKLRKRMIDKCWVQDRWSPSINKNGAYFCEIAASIGMLFDIKGWDLTKEWWNKKPSEFQDQIDIFCSKCSMCIPFSEKLYASKEQYISYNNLEAFMRAKTVGVSRFRLYFNVYTKEDYNRNKKEWKPGEFRDFYQCEPEKRLTKEEYERL